MDTRAFENSPELAPLLVQLYDNQKLYNFDESQKPQACHAVTDTISALLSVPLAPHMREILTDVLVGLMRQAESDLRKAVAERLALMDDVPLRMVLLFANDEISVATPVLRESAMLSDMDLLYIIKAQGAAYWQAIAMRGGLSAPVINVLSETEDLGTAVALSENDRITLTDHALSILTKLAGEQDLVATPLLARKDLPETIVRKLYEVTGKAVRSEIIGQFGPMDARLEALVGDVLVEFSSAPSSEYMPSAIMMQAADRAASSGLLTITLMLESLQRGQISNFIALFARYTGLSAQRVHDFLKQPCPKGLAIACRAFAIQKGDFSRIYLLTHRMRAVDRIVNHKDMLDLLSYFDKVKPDMALRLVHRVG